MTKRFFILLTLLLGVTGLVGWNLGAMNVAQARQEQNPTAGPDPAIDPDILLLNAQPVPTNQHLALQTVITNVGDSDMTSDGLITVYAALTDTFTTTWPLGGRSFAPLTATAVVTLPVYAQEALPPGDYYIYAQLAYTDDVDLTNNLAGPLTVTVVAAEIHSDIFTTRYGGDGRLGTHNLAVFGPDSCTSMGDPFSPDASPWTPGLYTYRFRILIPPTYAYDIVRVELFDPDSMNQPGNTFEVQHTNLAQSLGMPPFDTRTCSNGTQQQPCLLNTGEGNLGVPLDDINPLWFVRIDENRYGSSGSNSYCGMPGSYQTSLNTQTVYDLYYWVENPDGTLAQVSLATYTGQVGDGIRDDGSHLTDMQWVAPGSTTSVGQPVSVPTDCGSPNGGDYDPITCPDGTAVGVGSGFEINLTQDIPGVVTNPATGNRYLYLDVTTISGASENGFDIWAGPNTYVNDIFSDVNLRNVQILNDYGAHASQGVTVLALNNLPLNSNYTNRVEIPLAEVGPEYAGETIEVSLFDSDSGSSPPIHFYFDSIAFDDWHITFSGTEGGRCQIGTCNNQWVTPPYTFTVPGDLENCDYANPDDSCIPFYGGSLIASYNGGNADTYGWQVHLPPAPELDATQGCSAFPIAIHEDIRSVNPPDSGGNPYPDPADFDYPPDPPAYDDFLDHRPDIPLADAQEGDVYRAYQGFGSDNFGWLLWNAGIGTSANTLANSLAWPGDTADYTNHGDGGVPATPLYPWVVRGYVNPDDTSDLSLGLLNWAIAYTGVANSSNVQQQLNAHIDSARYLRLAVWDDVRVAGSNSAYRTARFAIFRLAGYSFQGQGWILLEFMHWDDSCGQLTPPFNLDVNGPTTGFPQQPYTFTANVMPISTTQPITYTWQATGQSAITHTGGLSDTAVFSWPDVGEKVVTVTAVNPQGIVTATHAITVFPANVPLTAVLLTAPSTSMVGEMVTFMATAVPPTATLPITYTWQASHITGTITHTGGLSDTAVFQWDSWGEKVVTVTAVSELGDPITATHTITLTPWHLYLPIALKPN